MNTFSTCRNALLSLLMGMMSFNQYSYINYVILHVFCASIKICICRRRKSSWKTRWLKLWRSRSRWLCVVYASIGIFSRASIVKIQVISLNRGKLLNDFSSVNSAKKDAFLSIKCRVNRVRTAVTDRGLGWGWPKRGRVPSLPMKLCVCAGMRRGAMGMLVARCSSVLSSFHLRVLINGV